MLCSSLLGMYTLDESHNPVPAESVEQWTLRHSNFDLRVVQVHEICDGAVKVSTVFLGLDHNFDPQSSSPPILFETMVFGGDLDGYQERCCTWNEAVAQHTRALDKVWKSRLKDSN